MKRNVCKGLGLVIMVFALGMILSLAIPPRVILFLMALIMIAIGFAIFRIF